MRRAVLIGLAMTGAGAAIANGTPTAREMLACSALFEARSDWIVGLEGVPEAAALMSRYADNLLVARAATLGSQDWGIVIGPANPGRFYTASRDALALDILTGFVERDTAHLPICMEDRACTYCTEVVRQISN